MGVFVFRSAPASPGSAEGPALQEGFSRFWTVAPYSLESTVGTLTRDWKAEGAASVIAGSPWRALLPKTGPPGSAYRQVALV